MASSNLRSVPEHWLTGKPVSKLSTARLPHIGYTSTAPVSSFK